MFSQFLICVFFSSAAAVSPQTTLEDGEVVEVEAEAVPHQPVSAPPPALQAPQSFNFQQYVQFSSPCPRNPPDRRLQLAQASRGLYRKMRPE